MLSTGLTFQSKAEAHNAAGLIGPNAVLQLAAALQRYPGLAERIFASAGFSRLLTAPPDAMIDQAIPSALFDALWREVPPDQARAIAQDAGRRTGAYILANRIPRPARLILRLLPDAIAAPILLTAIRKHAWTFAGTGTCLTESAPGLVIQIAENPLKMPESIWHVGVFESLFRALIHPQTQVRHSYASLGGRSADRFDIEIGSRQKPG